MKDLDLDELQKTIEDYEAEHEPWERGKARREKVRRLHQQLTDQIKETVRLRAWLETNYAEYLRKDPWAPRKWLRKGKLGKHLARTKFEEVYAELARQALPFKARNRKLTQKLGGYAWEGERPQKEITLSKGTVQPAEKKRMDLIVIPDAAEIAEELEMTERNVRNYLSEMVRCGVLEELPHRLGRGQRAFKMGEWGLYRDAKTGTFELRRYWTLKCTDRKILAKLRTFKVSGE
jgi:DNA-binding transcriptional regulator PaaX